MDVDGFCLLEITTTAFWSLTHLQTLLNRYPFQCLLCFYFTYGMVAGFVNSILYIIIIIVPYSIYFRWSYSIVTCCQSMDCNLIIGVVSVWFQHLYEVWPCFGDLWNVQTHRSGMSFKSFYVISLKWEITILLSYY